MRPKVPPASILSPDSGPRVTVAGPKLTAPLQSLGAAGLGPLVQVATSRGQSGVRGWLVSGMVMLLLLLFGAVLVVYVAPHSSADAKSLPADAPATPVAKEDAHPLARFVEVTGFRIVVDYNRKSEIHYLLVNHSATELNDLTVLVTLSTRTAKPGQPPLARFSFRANGIAPFESKEMVSPIEKPARTVALPEWQDLRAEVQIGQ